jgi:hypothetical protein
MEEDVGAVGLTVMWRGVDAVNKAVRSAVGVEPWSQVRAVGDAVDAAVDEAVDDAVWALNMERSNDD